MEQHYDPESKIYFPEAKEDDLSVTNEEDPYETAEYEKADVRGEKAAYYPTEQEFIYIGVGVGIAVILFLVICICCIKNAKKNDLSITIQIESEYGDNTPGEEILDKQTGLLNNSQ